MIFVSNVLVDRIVGEASERAGSSADEHLDFIGSPPHPVYVVTGGTGRFAGAIGSGTFTWSINPDIPAPNITVTVDGTIDYKRK